MKSTRLRHSELTGYLFVLLAGTHWAAAGTLAKYMMTVQKIPAIVLAEMRVTIASGVLFVCLYLKNRHLLRVKRQDLVYLAIFGIVGIAGVHYMYYYAISKTNVATAILLQYLGPAFIMLFAVVFQGESFSFIKLSALLLAFTGCFLMVGGYNLNLFEANKAGLAGGLSAAGFFAFYTLFGEYGLKKYSVWTMLLYGFMAASLFWWCLNPPWNIFAAQYSWRIWLLFLFLGIFSAVVPFGLYFTGIRHIRATQASIVAMIEPVAAGVIAYLFLNETMLTLQIVGGGLVLLGIGLLQITRHPRHIKRKV